MSSRIGIDTGGTFTDFVLLDGASGTFRTAKVPSTPDDPSRAINAGLAQLAGADSAGQVVVGTTVATNAVIQRLGPTVLFVTNEGFQDVLFIGRLDKERLYDLHWREAEAARAPPRLHRRRRAASTTTATTVEQLETGRPRHPARAAASRRATTGSSLPSPVSSRI